MASSARRLMPGYANIDSAATGSANMNASGLPKNAMNGMAACCSAWRAQTTRGGCPIAKRQAEIATDCPSEEIQVLERNRLVESHLVAEGFHLVRWRAQRQQYRRRVAAQPRQRVDND